jgi:hypothetical protein
METLLLFQAQDIHDLTGHNNNPNEKSCQEYQDVTFESFGLCLNHSNKQETECQQENG